jgi:hypothetical protein
MVYLQEGTIKLPRIKLPESNERERERERERGSNDKPLQQL